MRVFDFLRVITVSIIASAAVFGSAQESHADILYQSIPNLAASTDGNDWCAGCLTLNGFGQVVYAADEVVDYFTLANPALIGQLSFAYDCCGPLTVAIYSGSGLVPDFQRTVHAYYL